MKIALSDHFNWRRLLRFVTPTILMMMVTSIYTMVDGIFVSNYTGTTPFAAVNLIFPVLAMWGAIGFMLSTGGTALVSKLLGQGDKDKANSVFSLLVYVTIALGAIIAVVGAVTIRPIAIALGASGYLLEQAVAYGVVYVVGTPAFMLQILFQSFFVTAERPKLGLLMMLLAGATNIVLDGVLVAGCHLGVPAAAMATVLSQVVAGCIPLIYFVRPNSSLLRLSTCRFDGRALLKTCTNGSSELMVNISGSVVNMLYNMQLMRLVGEAGVAAYGFMMYVCFLFLAVFFGYSMGVAPIVGYNYGADNRPELHNVWRKSMLFFVLVGALMVGISEAMSAPLSQWFVGYDPTVYALSVRGFRLYSICFILAGFNVFGSGFFTALNNGFLSALISFMRTLVFQIGCVLLLPMWLGVDGIWLSAVVAEALCLVLTFGLLAAKRRRYGY